MPQVEQPAGSLAPLLQAADSGGCAPSAGQDSAPSLPAPSAEGVRGRPQTKAVASPIAEPGAGSGGEAPASAPAAADGEDGICSRADLAEALGALLAKKGEGKAARAAALAAAFAKKGAGKGRPEAVASSSAKEVPAGAPAAAAAERGIGSRAQALGALLAGKGAGKDSGSRASAAAPPPATRDGDVRSRPAVAALAAALAKKGAGKCRREARRSPRQEDGARRSWREERAEAETREAARRAPFVNLRISALPPGPLEAPRWETAFAAEVPDAGSTGTVLLVATLAGSYALKFPSGTSEEHFAAHFLRQLDIQTPSMRIVSAGEPERVAILLALERVAGLYERRADRGSAQRVRVRRNAAKHVPQLLVMELVQGMVLSSVGDRIATLLDFPGGSREAACPSAVMRLQALGRCWVADALLKFRDRFASPLSRPGYYTKRETDDWRNSRLTGNADNYLLTEFTPHRTGLVVLDNHIMHMRSATSPKSGAEASVCRQESLTFGAGDWAGHIGRHFSELLAEVEAEGREAPADIIPRSVEFMQYTVKAKTGHMLSASALREMRLGALHALRDSQGAIRQAVESFEELLRAAADEDSSGTSSASSVNREREVRRDPSGARGRLVGRPWDAHKIDLEALQACGTSVAAVAQEYQHVLDQLPEAATRDPATGAEGATAASVVPVPENIEAATSPVVDPRGAGAEPAADAALNAEAAEVGACAQLWRALPKELRPALKEEVLGS